MKQQPFVHGLAALCLAGAAGPGLAQTAAVPAAAASAPTLDPVRVKAQRDRETAATPVIGYVARRSAGVMRTDTPLNEIPQAVSIITADQVRDQGSKTMQEALRYTAGVRSEMYGLDNRGDWFSMRGGSEGSVLLDGLRLPLTGWWGTIRQEPWAFDRIEVLRGPASVLAGQNGPGGVVNLVSKRPQAEALREVEVQWGNHAHRQIAADLTGPLNEDGSLLYRVVALVKDSGSQVRYADEERRFFAPSLTWRPGGGTRVTAYAEYQKDRSLNQNGFFPIEGTLRPAPNGFIPTDTFIGEPDWDRYGGERMRVGYALEQPLDERWTLRHQLRSDRVDGGMRTMYAAWWEGFRDATGAPDPDGRHLNRLWYAMDDHSRTLNADLTFEGRLQWGGVRHTLLLGLDTMRHRQDQRAWADDYATPLDVYDPVYGTFPEPDWASLPSSTTRSEVRTTGLVLQDQMKLGERLVLVGALRHDRARTDGERDSATTRNLGLVWLADGGWSPYASWSESFEPVPGDDFFGNRFVPKRGRQVEAGLKWAPADRRVAAAAAVYRLKEKNRLATDPDPTHPNASVQLGEVTVQGLELEAQATWRHWELVASYTYTDARQTQVGADALIYLDKQLSGIPRHSAALWAVHRFADLASLRAGAGLRHVGTSSDGVDGTITPASTLLDLMLSWDDGPWRLALNVSNATDRTTIATCLERGDCWFGTRRKAVLSASWRW